MYFILYPNCQIVQGATNSIICDLQRGDIFEIDSELVSLIHELKRQPYESVIQQTVDINKKAEIENIIESLEQNELGFFTSVPELFPPLSLEWSAPSPLTNLVVEENTDKLHDLSILKSFIIKYSIKFVQWNIVNSCESIHIERVCEMLRSTKVRGIEFFIASFADLDTWKYISQKHQRISAIHLLGSEREAKYDNIFLHKQDYKSLQCGHVSPDLFHSNIPHFTESQKNNSCLNRKAAIDSEGNLSPCPYFPLTITNIYQDEDLDITENKTLQKLWAINKDEVEVCKDCEYRYVCTDCRVYTTNKGPYSKPSSCKYDPYTGLWND